jgi:predicted metal-binding membrane protein
MVGPAAPLADFSDLIAPTIVLAAGIYQLTPLKRSFMMRCRTPQAKIHQSTGRRSAE